jgi:hypothetical protein
MTINSTVREFIWYERLDWDAHCTGVRAYHAWPSERKGGVAYTASEHAGSSFFTRFTLLLTSYRRINAGSNGFNRSHTSSGF